MGQWGRHVRGGDRCGRPAGSLALLLHIHVVLTVLQEQSSPEDLLCVGVEQSLKAEAR